KEPVILDGRNRLDAMELVGMEIMKLIGKEYRLSVGVRYLSWGENLHFPDSGRINPYSYTISMNIHPRHPTKEMRADLILQAIKLEEGMNFYSNKSSFSPNPGQRGGSTRNPSKQKFLERAGKEGISKATAQKSWDKDRGPVQKHREHAPVAPK